MSYSFRLNLLLWSAALSPLWVACLGIPYLIGLAMAVVGGSVACYLVLQQEDARIRSTVAMVDEQQAVEIARAIAISRGWPPDRVASAPEVRLRFGGPGPGMGSSWEVRWHWLRSSIGLYLDVISGEPVLIREYL